MTGQAAAIDETARRVRRDERELLPIPFLELLQDIAEGEKQDRFDQGALFWSLSRLFGCYYRIVAVYDPEGLGPNTKDYTFLEADIENFFIRVRVVLNNLAFSLRKLYPKKVPGLASWSESGAGRMKASFRAYRDFILSKPHYHPAMTEVLIANQGWLQVMIDHREDVLHYTGMAVVFEPNKSSRSFSILRSGVPPEPNRPVKQMYPVFDFINLHMRHMLTFIDVDLLRAVTAYADEYSLNRRPLGIPHSGRMQSPGTGLYRLVNHIEVPVVMHSTIAGTPESAIKRSA
jgi:hypothetical protein